MTVKPWVRLIVMFVYPTILDLFIIYTTYSAFHPQLVGDDLWCRL